MAGSKTESEEHRREFDSEEEMVCPNGCEEGVLEEDGMPLYNESNGFCTSCGQKYQVKYTMIWKDGDTKEDK